MDDRSHLSWRRRFLVPLVAMWVVLATPGIASAHHSGPGGGDPVCPHFNNWGSTACFYGVTHYGSYAEWHSNMMLMDHALESTGRFVAHGIWAYSGAPCGQYFIEQGLSQGWQGQIAYVFYVAKVNVNGYSDYNVGYTSPTAANVAYRLRYDGNGSYSARRDGVQIMSFGGFGYGTCMSQTVVRSASIPLADQTAVASWIPSSSTLSSGRTQTTHTSTAGIRRSFGLTIRADNHS